MVGAVILFSVGFFFLGIYGAVLLMKQTQIFVQNFWLAKKSLKRKPYLM